MTGWHIDAAVAHDYASGELATPLAASVEAHVANCPRCQATLRPVAPKERLDSLWAGVVDQIDAPRVGWVERAIRGLGLSDGDARLAVSAPALRGAWLLSIVFLLTFAVVASGAPRMGPDLFLLLAPMLPVLGVGLAYGPWVDPTYETTLAAPYSSVRLIVLRTGIVLVLTTVLAALASVFIPGHGTAVVWLLPAAALVALTLALAVWLPVLVAALLVSGLWVLSVYSVWLNDRTLDPLFSRDAQVAALILLALAIAICAGALRAHAYDLRRFM